MDNIDNIDTDEVCPKNSHDKKCAPGISFEAGSCIKLTILIEMALAFNKENTESEIKLYPNMESLNPHKYKKYLLLEFSKRIGDKCTTQQCWSTQKFVKHMTEIAKDELTKYTFRPTGPEGRFEWLNTLNVDDTMQQYELKYPDFKFIGTVPIDFDDFEAFGIINLNYSDLLNQGKTKLGFVFNLDKHDEPGSHWVALFANIKEGQVYFFDSYGTKPDQRIRTLMRRISRFCEVSLGKKEEELDVEYNKDRHQYENSECGVYSINFILRLLRGDTFKEICESKIPDKVVNKCRKLYFRNANFK